MSRCPLARVRVRARGGAGPVASARVGRIAALRRSLLHNYQESPLASAPPTIEPSDISPISIVEEMKTSYLDYAMSVIVARALPDVRDGLKPVHRRILYACQEGGFVARPALPQVGQDRRRRDGQLPPARRLRDLRRARPDGPGLVDAGAADRRPGQFRLDGPRSAGLDALHRGAARQGRDDPARRSRQGHGRLHPQLRRRRARSRRSCRRASPTCWSTAPAASRSAWRPTSRRTISAR